MSGKANCAWCDKELIINDPGLLRFPKAIVCEECVKTIVYY